MEGGHSGKEFNWREAQFAGETETIVWYGYGISPFSTRSVERLCEWSQGRGSVWTAWRGEPNLRPSQVPNQFGVCSQELNLISIYIWANSHCLQPMQINRSVKRLWPPDYTSILWERSCFCNNLGISVGWHEDLSDIKRLRKVGKHFFFF